MEERYQKISTNLIINSEGKIFEYDQRTIIMLVGELTEEYFPPMQLLDLVKNL